MPNDSASYRGDGTMTSRFIGAEKDEESIKAAQDKARLSSTAGSGLGAKAKSMAGMPKPGPGEDSMSPAYREKVRVWRETEAQKRAFK